MRIVSLLPSATEIVCAIGLGDRLVGVSHECDHPPGVRSLPRLTRSLLAAEATSAGIDAAVRTRLQERQPLYALDADLLERLRPDLVVTQALCDVCAVAEADVKLMLRQLEGLVGYFDLDPNRVADLVLDAFEADAGNTGGYEIYIYICINVFFTCVRGTIATNP